MVVASEPIKVVLEVMATLDCENLRRGDPERTWRGC